jgi:hypothetical protein
MNSGKSRFAIEGMESWHDWVVVLSFAIIILVGIVSFFIATGWTRGVCFLSLVVALIALRVIAHSESSPR